MHLLTRVSTFYICCCAEINGFLVTGPRRRFKSSRLQGEFEKPWLEDKKKQWNWDSTIFYTCIFIGLGKSIHHSESLLANIFSGIGGYLCWKETTGVPNHEVSTYSLRRSMQ